MNSRIKLEQIVFGAALMSIAVVMKLFLTFQLPLFRFSFFEFPIILSGLLLGPFAALVGLGTDLIYILVNPHGVTLNPLFTIEAILYGLIPGLYFYFFKYKLSRYAVVLAITLLLCLGVNTIGLALIFDSIPMALSSLPLRATRDLGKFFIHLYLINAFAKNRSLTQFSIIKKSEHFNID